MGVSKPAPLQDPLAPAEPLCARFSGPYRYWEHCGGADSCPAFQRFEPASPSEEKFLLFETRGAGFNNERMSLEIAYALAFGWHRTLVLPPVAGNPSNPRSFFKFEDIYDLAAMNQGVKTITADEFVSHVRQHPDLFPGATTEDVNAVTYHERNDFKGTSWRQWPGWWKFPAKIVREIFTDLVVAKVMYGAPLAEAHAAISKGGGQAEAAASLQQEFVGNRRHGVAQLTPDEEASVALHLPPRALLGNFYTAVFHPDPLEWWRLRSAVRRFCRLQEAFFHGAEAAIAAFGGQIDSYSALHNRQGDWQVCVCVCVCVRARVSLCRPG